MDSRDEEISKSGKPRLQLDSQSLTQHEEESSHLGIFGEILMKRTPLLLWIYRLQSEPHSYRQTQDFWLFLNRKSDADETRRWTSCPPGSSAGLTEPNSIK